MANLRNEFEFRSALLTALGQEHTEAEAKNEDTWRRKMLDGLGVEYDQNDVNQFGLFREKLIEGVTSKSEGGGGGESDFSTAEVEFKNQTTTGLNIKCCCIVGNNIKSPVTVTPAHNSTFTVVLYKGSQQVEIPFGVELTTATGDITVDSEEGIITINGSGTVLFQP